VHLQYAKPGTLRAAAARWWQVYLDMVFIRWANIRNEWYFGLIVGLLFPLALLGFLRMSGAAVDPAAGLYVTAGNATVALVMGPMQSLCNDLAWGRQRNDLEYYAALPVSKLQLTLAFATVSAIFIAPSIFLAVAVGKLMFGFPVYWSIWLLPVMLLSALSMAGVGILAGVHARSGHHANMINSIAMVAVMFLSPVLIPYDNLPRLMQWTSRLLPTSYAADAFRAALAGETGLALWGNVGAIAAFAVVTLYWATRRLDWRVE
jgi:ABC-2 type transport system permease protein